MTIYEKRTYNIKVGHMAEVHRLYLEEGMPAIEAGGFDKHLVGYFTSDTGRQHELIHVWRFETDSERRAFWKDLLSDETFLKFVVQIRNHIEAQEVQLLNPAPWGPRP